MKKLRQYKLLKNYKTLNTKQINYIKQYFYDEYINIFKEEYQEYANSSVRVELDYVPDYDITLDYYNPKDHNFYIYFVVENEDEYIRVADLWIPEKTTKNLNTLLKEHVTQIYY